MARMQLLLTVDQMSRLGFQVNTRVSLVGCEKELLDPEWGDPGMGITDDQ